jgi:hypothetical protein
MVYITHQVRLNLSQTPSRLTLSVPRRHVPQSEYEEPAGMSFQSSGRKFQSKNGKSFPDGPAHNGGRFAEAIARALKEEFGAGPSAVKTVARLTNANERAARNWLEGKNGPNGEYLVRLIRNSDVVLESLLALAGRSDRALTIKLVGLRAHLVEAISAIDDAHSG